MRWIDWVLLAGVLSAVGVALYFALRPKKSGCCQSGCTGNCAGCSCNCEKKRTDKR